MLTRPHSGNETVSRRVPARKAAGEAEGAYSALYLTEMLSELNGGAQFLDRLTLEEVSAVRRVASSITLAAGETVFLQGDRHNGIFLIESGRVRIYYAGPSGREITLAYWTPGHFIGGPELFGGGFHIWSASVVETARLAYLPGGAIRQLALTVPAVALCLIEGLVAKGKCYSALVQMLGTRSVTERLAQLLLILAELDERGGQMAVKRRITHEQIASIVGSTRQWVTSTLRRFQKRGIIHIQRGTIIIERADLLRAE